MFASHTAANVNKVLTITLDKRVISAPRINSAITGGSGQITGSFTADEANALAIQLRYGSLPIPVKVVESRTVGATVITSYSIHYTKLYDMGRYLPFISSIIRLIGDFDES